MKISLMNKKEEIFGSPLFIPHTVIARLYFFTKMQINKVILLSLIPIKDENDKLKGFRLDTEKMITILDDNEMPPYRPIFTTAYDSSFIYEKYKFTL